MFVEVAGLATTLPPLRAERPHFTVAPMFWPIRAIPDDLRRQLAAVASRRAASIGACYFSSLDRSRTRWLCVIGSSILASALAFGTFSAVSSGETVAAWVFGGMTVLPMTWAIVLFVEAVRGGRSSVRPFVLITPAAVLRADFDHGYLEAIRLADATDFEIVNQYDQRQKFRARQYAFKFPNGTINVSVTTPQDIALIDEVLALARLPGHDASTASLVPTTPGLARLPAMRGFSDPFGVFWLAVGVLLGIAALVAVIVFRR